MHSHNEQAAGKNCGRGSKLWRTCCQHVARLRVQLFDGVTTIIISCSVS